MRTLTTTDAVLLAAIVSMLWQVVGHYVWMPPRHVLHKLEAYTWGVGGILIGTGVYGWITTDWQPAIVGAVLAAVSGFATVAMWLTDSHGDSVETIEDLRARIAELERRLNDVRR